MKFQLKSLSVISVFSFFAVGAATGCVATSDESPEDNPDDVAVAGDGDGDMATVTGDGDGTVTGDGDGTRPDDSDLFGGSCPVEPCDTGDGDMSVDEPLEIEVNLPFNVSDVFGPSGFMGAQNDLVGEINETEGIVMDETGCAAEQRPEGAAGECFAVTYTPQYLTPCSEAQLAEDPECAGGTWAGVFFQNPELNWGESAGVVIEPGATKLVFTAWTDGEDQDLNFLAGGIGTLGTAYADTFKVESAMTVTGTPTQYELDLSSANYEMVLGGFGWTIEVNSMDPVVFYLDDMRWVAE